MIQSNQYLGEEFELPKMSEFNLPTDRDEEGEHSESGQQAIKKTREKTCNFFDEAGDQSGDLIETYTHSPKDFYYVYAFYG